MKHYQILDHELDLGIRGLISVVGVKFTTARDVAEKTVNLLVRKLARRTGPCQTATMPVHGGQITDVSKTVKETARTRSLGIGVGSLCHLVQTYGSRFGDVLAYCHHSQRFAEPVEPGIPILKAEVIHGIRAEMAQTLSDIVFRRTDLGTAGYPGDLCLDNCARLVATELQWSESRLLQEKEAVRAQYRRVSCLPQTDHVACES
jgi:glycerol-3-phosphate dehydrogenase